MKPAVSVIIPHYNARQWIAETLDSVLGTAPAGTEVLCVDDGSTDGTQELLASRYSGVRRIVTENRGVSAARNLGFQESSGDFCVFLDADDLLCPGKLERQLSLAKRADVEVVYGDWKKLVQDDRGAWVTGEVIGVELPEPYDVSLLGQYWWPTGAYLLNRKLVERVGGFNGALPVIQDARFAIDCAIEGARFARDPNVCCHYRVHKSGSVSTSSAAAFYRDVFKSGLEVEQDWIRRGMLDDVRRKSLLSVLDSVARCSVGVAPDLFEAAVKEVSRVSKDAELPARGLMQVVYRVAGYRRGRLMSHRLRSWLGR
jgi:glycosyltransferase involved in cell wall biosynthesis